MEIRRSILCAVALFCFPNMAAAQPPKETPPSYARLYLSAWVPELGTVNVLPGSPDAKLLGVADLARRGKYNSAESELSALERASNDKLTQYMIYLFRNQIWQRRYRPLGGGSLFRGESHLDKLVRDIDSAKLEKQISQLFNELLPRNPGLMLALTYDNVLSGSDFSFPLLRTEQFNTPLIGVLQPSLAPSTRQQFITPLYNFALTTDLSDEIDRQRIGIWADLLEGDFAATQQDFTNANKYFERALANARASHNLRGTLECLFRLGDLKASPNGSVHSFGYNIVGEDRIRHLLSFGITPNQTVLPTDDAVQSAGQRYKEAEVLIASNSMLAPLKYQLTIRLAHLSRMHNDYQTAIQRYGEAASQAQAADVPSAAAVARASQALLTGSFDGLLDAFTRLVKNGDLGAAISVAELALSWSTRIWLWNHDTEGSIACLRVTAKALEMSNLNRTAVDILVTLSDVYRSTGRTEKAIDVLEDAIAAQRRHVSTIQEIDLKLRAAFPILQFPDPANIYSEKNTLSLLLNKQGTSLNAKFMEEGLDRWKERLDKNDQEWRSIMTELSTPGPLTAAFPALVQKAEALLKQSETIKQYAPLLYDAQVALANFRNVQDYLKEYDIVRDRAKSLGNPVFLLNLDTFAARIDPARMHQARTALAQTDPLAPFIQLLSQRPNAPTVDYQMQARVAGEAVSNHFDLAIAFEDWQLLEQWLNKTTELVAGQPSWQFLQPWLDKTRAIVLIGKHQPADALEVLNRMLAQEQMWYPANPSLKIAVLNLLIEANSQLGNPEAALLAVEQLRGEQEQIQIVRNGILPNFRSSAELAKLDRKMALDSGLTPEEVQRRRVLLEMADNIGVQRRVGPSAKDLNASLLTVPPATTVLTFWITQGAITAWRAGFQKPLQMTRLKAPVAETLQLINQYQEKLVNANSGWELLATELYDRLIRPLGAIDAGQTITIIGHGALRNLTFDGLVPGPGKILLSEHPIVYTDHLMSTGSSEGVATLTNPMRLVAGLNGLGLTFAEDEATDIAEQIRTTPLLGTNVTAKRLHEILPNAQWIHLATHGQIDLENRYLSSLALSGEDRIEAWELFRDCPQAEMIVLSACDTKQVRPDLVAGTATDTTSLASFAFTGGARWVLASQWLADDRWTKQLMHEFYHSLITDRVDPPHALQQAKLALVKRNIGPAYYSHLLLSVRSLSAQRGGPTELVGADRNPSIQK